MNPKKHFDIVFAGTPEFAVISLQALLNSPHNIKAVYTKPDKPAGRGQKLMPSPVKQLALENHLLIHQPSSLKDEKAIFELRPDVIVVVAYGLMIPKSILELPKFGCINIHPSLLPRWRGAAPIQRAILEGDKQTGVTIMKMTEELDAGPSLYQVTYDIQPNDTSETLHNRLAMLGSKALLDTLDILLSQSITPKEQDASQVTYAHKILKEEAKINWNLSAEEINRKVHAFNPWPGAVTHVDDQIIKLWQSSVIDSQQTQLEAGIILQINSDGIDVATGKGVLRLLEIQLPGKQKLSSHEAANVFRQRGWKRLSNGPFNFIGK